MSTSVTSWIKYYGADLLVEGVHGEGVGWVRVWGWGGCGVKEGVEWGGMGWRRVECGVGEGRVWREWGRVWGVGGRVLGGGW